MQQWFSNPERPVFVIGEVAQAHDGSLGTAHAFIDAVAASGAHAVKFQTHLAHAESTRHEPWRVPFSTQDETRYDYWKRMEFTEPQWAGLAAHARERGLVFLSTPFSIEALELLQGLGVRAWKVGSGELTNEPLLERMAATGRPVLLSTGMATWDEIDRAMALVRGDAPVALLQCTSAYPCPPERVGLNVLGQMRDRYGTVVGLSDHSGTIYPSLAAVALGAEILEVHVTLSRSAFGPDVPASVTPAELGQIVEGSRSIRVSLRNPVNKDELSAELYELKRAFGKSVVAERHLVAGHVLTAGDLSLKKPGTGLPPSRLPDLIGRTLVRAVAADELITDEDVG